MTMKGPREGNYSALTTHNISSPRGLQNKSVIDTKLARNMERNQKAFTSQLDMIPGPKNNVIKHVGE